MNKIYEYKVCAIKVAEIENILNKLGSEGWELFKMSDAPPRFDLAFSEHQCTFRREVKKRKQLLTE